MPLSKNQLEDFYRDGFILVPDLFDPNQMKAALSEMETIFYGKNFSKFLSEMDNGSTVSSVEPTPTVAVPHYGNTEYGRAQFPTGADALDRLIENDEYLDIFEK